MLHMYQKMKVFLVSSVLLFYSSLLYKMAQTALCSNKLQLNLWDSGVL